jgi:hypothetical protein
MAEERIDVVLGIKTALSSIAELDAKIEAVRKKKGEVSLGAQAGGVAGGLAGGLLGQTGAAVGSFANAGLLERIVMVLEAIAKTIPPVADALAKLDVLSPAMKTQEQVGAIAGQYARLTGHKMDPALVRQLQEGFMQGNQFEQEGRAQGESGLIQSGAYGGVWNSMPEAMRKWVGNALLGSEPDMMQYRLHQQLQNQPKMR